MPPRRKGRGLGRFLAPVRRARERRMMAQDAPE
jgi:hypothetical protein